MPHPDRRRIEVGAGRSQRADDVESIRIVPRPIGEEMQRRSPVTFPATFRVLDHAMGEAGIGSEQPAQPTDLALLECRRELDGKRLVNFGACEYPSSLASLQRPNRLTARRLSGPHD